MPAIPYFGTYGRFMAYEKGQGAVLAGADSIIGREMMLDSTHEKAGSGFVVKNMYGGACGKLDEKTCEAVKLCYAKEWVVHVLLASVYQGNGLSNAQHWGEVVVISYPPSKADCFDRFVQGISSMLEQGIRPEVNLQQASIAQILESQGAWKPTGRHPVAKAEDSVLLKDQITFNERLVEGARSRNPGCMAAGWLFIGLLFAAALFLVKTILGL